MKLQLEILFCLLPVGSIAFVLYWSMKRAREKAHKLELEENAKFNEIIEGLRKIRKSNENLLNDLKNKRTF